MSKVITHKCNSCGAPLTVSGKGGKYTCPFCGTINLFEADHKNEEGILCPECGALNPKDAQHCSECGMKFNLPCPKCGSMNPAGTVYCIRCGVNIQDELNRKQAIEAQWLYKETLRKQKREKQKKQRRIWLPIYFALLLICLGSIYYSNNLSPRAKAQKEAAQAETIRITQQAVEMLHFQYPYHNSNDVYSVYLKDICLQYDQNGSHWWAITNFLYTLDDTNKAFNWDFENTWLEDSLGNTFPATNNSASAGTGQVQSYFNGESTSGILHFKLAAESIPEITIPFDLSDPALTGSCK